MITGSSDTGDCFDKSNFTATTCYYCRVVAFVETFFCAFILQPDEVVFTTSNICQLHQKLVMTEKGAKLHFFLCSTTVVSKYAVKSEMTSIMATAVLL